MINSSRRFARRAVKVDQALSLIMQRVTRLAFEHVPLEASLNRRLSESVISKENMPHFRRSGLDGYAVASEDAALATPQIPARLKVIDEVPAGSVSSKQVVPGTAIRVMTGSAVPEGANAVVMFEQTEELQADGQGCILIKHKVACGQNIANIGDEIATGQWLMGAGTRIGPGQIALLASLGYEKVRVVRRPKVGVLTTGSELIPPGEPLTPGKIRNSNALMLAAQIQQYGGMAIQYGTVSDDIHEVNGMIRKALEECDMLLVSGGVSVGDYDVMAEYFTTMHGKGMELLFNKVAMRPGSPTSAATVHTKLLFGLSGNPGACFVGFELFVRPALLAMQGIAEPLHPKMQAILTDDFDKGCPHDRYVRGVTSYANQQLRVSALKKNSSSMLVSIQHANCLMLIPSGSGGVSAGRQVEIIPLPYEITLFGREDE
ncbi:gephyrin-like molybdotransferase Glp [Paenibacillus oryzisoli]|uniref:molybdopterin molybdotransferase MoeA n=1 Tax=Paenibacillus oryzisoli TaxID=1850517 RepID=UPI003D276217